MYDLCVIGSGAAGLAAAITAAKRGASVILLDKNKKAGKKLYATGNGKCNITNKNINYGVHYHSSDESYVQFLDAAFGKTPYDSVIQFMDSIGLLTYSTTDGYVYPTSNQASSVVWAMSDAVNQYHVDFDFKAEVVGVRKEHSVFKIDTLNGQICALQVVLACGGKSYKALGGTESGYAFAKALGHSIMPVRPALCGVQTVNMHEILTGVRARAKATLTIDGTAVQEECGEIQFSAHGLSGIAIFNLSSLAGKNLALNKTVTVTLDFIHNMDMKQVYAIYKGSRERTVLGALNGILNDKLCIYILNMLGIDTKAKLSDINQEQYDTIVQTLQNTSFPIKALYDYNQAQVCAGGVNLQEIHSKSFESKITKNAYIVGETLDIDGICGGYNLTFALLSGICAGEHIYVTNQSN